MRSLVVLVTIAATAGSACYSLQPVNLEDLADHRTARIWVTTPDQSVVLLDDGQVFRGNLVGFVDGRYRVLQPQDLQELRVRRLAVARTASLIAGGTLAVAVGVVLASGREKTYDPCVGGPVDCNELARVGP